MSRVTATLPVALFEAPEPLRSGAFHRLTASLWMPAATDSGRGTLLPAAADYTPALIDALVARRLPEPERVALLLGLLAEAEREADPGAVGPVRRALRGALPQLVTLLEEAATDGSPTAAAREALLFAVGQLPEDAATISTAVSAAFGADSGAARALQGAWALAATQPHRARAILAYLGAEALHRAGPDREAMLARLLACPACHADLHLAADALHCSGCGLSFTWQGDIPSLVRPEDAALDQFPAARVAEYETGTRPRFVRVMTGDFDHAITPEREAEYLQHWLRAREGPVLDLACGAGGWTTAVAAVVGADRVVALDYSLPMLASVGTKVPRALRIHGSASALPIRESVLGGVNCSDALQALPDPAAALREVARTLQPGAPFTCFTMLAAPAPYGYFQARFPDHARARFTYDGLIAMLREAGLDLIDIVTVQHGVFCTARKPDA